MTNKILLLVAVIALSCTPQDAEPPESDCLKLDFSGTARWRVVSDSLYVEMFVGNFVGNLAGRFVDTDSGRTVFASVSGIFKAPPDYPDVDFEREGYMSLRGLMTSDGGKYVTMLHVVLGMEGFSDVTTGYFCLRWFPDDEYIYHGGTFCFADAE